MIKVLTTDYSNLPITLAQAKAFANVTTEYENTELTLMLKGCMAACEKFGRIHITSKEVTQMTKYYTKGVGMDTSKKFYLEAFPAGEIDAIQVLSNSGTYTDVEEANYRYVEELGCVFWDTLSRPLVVADIFGHIEFIRVDYTCGYGVTITGEGEDAVTTSNVPEDITLAVLTLFAHAYENRGVYQNGFFDPLPDPVVGILAPYRQARMNLC